MQKLLSLLFFCALALAFAPFQTANAQPRRWTVIVIVPEQHIARPNIPDPAVETSLSRQLINAGYKVIDQDRIKSLRYSAVMDRILAGGPNAQKEIVQLQRRFGADILITGEAFTMEVLRRNVETDLGTVTQIRCRARVELKGIRMATGEKIYADSIQKTGPDEPTVELSSKACLEDAADHLGPTMLAKLRGLSNTTRQNVELEIRNVGSFTRANQLETLIGRVPGVKNLSPADFDANTYRSEISLEKTQLRAFAARLESDAAFRRFKIKVQSANGSKIIARCQ